MPPHGNRYATSTPRRSRRPPSVHAPGGLSRRPTVLALQTAVLAWYDKQARNLPWRKDRNPYRVWVAEVMLQQTRLAVVVPAYRRFLCTFPTLQRLARADEDEVLASWSGLGYYARARSLHRAARVLDGRGDRHFPRDMEAARRLPGVGAYTAAAVLSIAYGQPHPAVDGNVTRVLSRVACLPAANARGEPQRGYAARLLSRERPGDWNQALMELGQSVCLPRTPRCEQCPIARLCQARRRDVVIHFPVPRRRKRPERARLSLLLMYDRRRRILLERGAFRHLDHLWLPLSPPRAGYRPAGSAHRRHGSFRHAIQNRIFSVAVWSRLVSAEDLRRAVCQPLRGGVERRIFTRQELKKIGRSSLLTKALDLLAGAGDAA